MIIGVDAGWSLYDDKRFQGISAHIDIVPLRCMHQTYAEGEGSAFPLPVSAVPDRTHTCQEEAQDH